MIDFSKITFSGGEKPDVSPGAVFTRLRRPESKYLRPTDEQGEILTRWFERRGERDLTIKLNTGAGKTLVGLLALQSSLEEGVSPAVYLVPDRLLQSQVLSEAQEIGVAVTDDADDLKFLSGKSVLVAVAHKLFNGRSVFGVGVGNKRIEIGALVVDDAHACLQIMKQQFTMTIPSQDETFKNLLNIFVSNLEAVSKPAALAISSGDPFKWLEVPFYKWKEKISDVYRVLVNAKSSEAEWKYPLVSEYLHLAQCVFSGSAVEIGLRHLPIEVIPAFHDAKRRIYMTATLADDGLLVSLIGANPDSVSKPITPEGVGSIGERLIIAPTEINPAIRQEDIVALAAEYSHRFNVVVLCPSKARAEIVWGGVGLVCIAESVQPTVERLRREHVGLVVLVNRYDGIDLPEAACRVLIIDETPQVVGLIERVEAVQIEGTHQAVIREIQKVEQGMGRAIRRVDDWCLILLVGGRLSQLTGVPKFRSCFSKATQAQLDLSHQITDQLLDQPIEKLKEALELILSRDKNWIAASRACIAGQRQTEFRAVGKEIQRQRAAFDFACVKNYHEAARQMEAAVNEAGENKIKGVLLQQQAEYTWEFDKLRTQQLLSGAIGLNRAVTPPESGIDYKRINASKAEQAAMIRERIRGWLEPREFLLEVRSIVGDLVWDEARTKRFESAIDWFGALLGFTAQRPDHEFRNGPDNLWALGDGTFLVIECKSGSKSDRISRSEIEQLLHSEAWFRETYGAVTKFTPVIIHPSCVLAVDAVASQECRVICGENLDNLRAAFNNFFNAICGSGTVADVHQITENLNRYGFTPAQFVQRYTSKPR